MCVTVSLCHHSAIIARAGAVHCAPCAGVIDCDCTRAQGASAHGRLQSCSVAVPRSLIRMPSGCQPRPSA
eukprot:13742953-Alexandrium_andersonii.AAC.1